MTIEPIAVVGLGLLGRGIAACFVGRGFEVIGYEPTPRLLDEARPHVERLTREVEEYTGAPGGGRFLPTTDPGALAGATLVLESVVEDLAVKEQVLADIERIVAPETIVATNTSAIPVTQLQQRLRHPGRFLGMHFAGPAHVTRFLEIIRGEQTDVSTIARAEALARRVGKEPCLCKDVPGFLVNRIAYAMYREAFHLLETGVADADTIDRAVRNTLSLWAAICGPFRWIDISGGPALYAAAMERVLPTLSAATTLPPTLERLRAADARGTRNGHGVFDYSHEDHARWAALWQENALRSSRLLDDLFPLPPPAEPTRHD